MTNIKLRYVNAYYDRHGKLRWYVRRKGQKRVPLPGRPGDEDYMRAYHAALAGVVVAKKTSRHPTGTLGALAEEFFKSAAYRNLKASSQNLYRKVLDPVLDQDGHRPAGTLPRDKAHKIIQDIGAKAPASANVAIAVLSKMMKLAINLGWRDSNPFAGMERYKLGEHRTWTEEELTMYEARWPIGTRERLAYDLLLWTAQRVGDVARMRTAELVRDPAGEDMIRLTQEKTTTPLVIPIHPALARSLAAIPRKGLALIGDVQGRQMRTQALRDLVARAATNAGLPNDCVPHGLRKAALRRLAENEATVKQIQAVGGHKSLSEVERYTKEADQKKLARSAIARLPDRGRNANTV